MLRILGIGGGSGLPALLAGLKPMAAGGFEEGLHISAVVCVSDDGGSSGLLRKSLGIPAVGDLRNCLAALSGADDCAADLFQHRFPDVESLHGHSLGNLILAALHEQSGGLSNAAECASRMLCINGRVMPVTETPVTLSAEFEDGSVAHGECCIAAVHKRIERLWIDPPNPASAAGVIENIEAADCIVVGPGSLYTSILPNLLVPQVASAIRTSSAVKVFVCNLMTQPGETAHFSATDHLRVLQECLGPRAMDVCVVNTRSLGERQAARYMESGSRAVEWEASDVVRAGVVPVPADLLSAGPLVRHDPEKLARVVVSLAKGALRARDIVCGQLNLAA